jgi:mannose-6-phosphate isomerase
VREGHALSLQFHEVKDETIYVQRGRIEFQIGPRHGELASEVVGPGRAFRLLPGTVHRMLALEDSLLLEVSTPDLDDVVRLDDRYGREGTSAA